MDGQVRFQQCLLDSAGTIPSEWLLFSANTFLDSASLSTFG